MQQQINFYQPDFRKETKAFSAVGALQACGVGLLMMSLAYGFTVYRLGGLQTELDVIAAQEAVALDHAQKLAPVILAVTGERSLSDRRDDALRTLEERQTVLSLVQGSALGDLNGFSRYLHSLARQELDGLWLTHITLSAMGDKTLLRGRALEPELVPVYVQRLSEETPFTGQRFQRFQIDRPEGDGVVEFSMTSEPSPTMGAVR